MEDATLDCTWNVPRQMVDGKPGWLHTGLSPAVLTPSMLRMLGDQQSQYSEEHTSKYTEWQKRVEDVKVITQPSQDAKCLTDAQFYLLCGALVLFMLL